MSLDVIYDRLHAVSWTELTQAVFVLHMNWAKGTCWPANTAMTGLNSILRKLLGAIKAPDVVQSKLPVIKIQINGDKSVETFELAAPPVYSPALPLVMIRLITSKSISHVN